MTDPGGGALQKEVDSEGEVLLDTAVVSRGILGLEGAGPSSLDEEGACVRPVRTGRNEGKVARGDNKGSGGSATDGKESEVSVEG